MAKRHIKKEGKYVFEVDSTTNTLRLLGGTINVTEFVELCETEELHGLTLVCGDVKNKDGNIPPIESTLRIIPCVEKSERIQTEPPIIRWFTNSTIHAQS